MYEIIIKPAALRQTRKLEPEIQTEVVIAIASLANDSRPDGCKKLKGEDSLYRIRVAKKYRIIYEIKDKKLTITVVKVGHRCDVYQ